MRSWFRTLDRIMSNVRACRAASAELVRPRLVARCGQPAGGGKVIERDVHGRYFDGRRLGILEQLEHGVVRRRTGVLYGLESYV